jgi:peptidoglycan/LPS O-acetylase OafA/YrhL
MFGFAALWILPGSRAVQIFYIISGFLMAMILNGKYADTLHGNLIFYTNRLVKIFAPYLIVLSSTVIVCLLSKWVTGHAVFLEAWFAEAANMTLSTWLFAVLTNIFIVGQEWGFLLVYRAGELSYSLQAYAEPPMGAMFTIVAPAWTLSLELMFYLIAPFLLRRHFLVIAGCAYLSYALRFYTYETGNYSEAVNYRFFPFELSLFLYGAAVHRATILLTVPLKVSAFITLSAALCVIFVPQYLNEHQYQFYALVGAALPALFIFSSASSLDRRLGDLSYPLYLVHWSVAGLLSGILRHLWPEAIGTAWTYPIATLVLSIVLAGILDRYIDIPLDHWRQRRALKGSRKMASKMPQRLVAG